MDSPEFYEELANLHAAIHAEGPSDDAILTAFVNFYAHKMNVIPNHENTLSTLIGNWIDERPDDAAREATSEAGRLIEPVIEGGGHRGWMLDHNEDSLNVYTYGHELFGIAEVTRLWRRIRIDRRQRHPLAPIVEAWVASHYEAPPNSELY